jgi:hypothetical protein
MLQLMRHISDADIFLPIEIYFIDHQIDQCLQVLVI